jgi:hypothetical protein
VSRLAFYTFAVLRERPGHPLVEGFFERVASNNAAAAASEGFLGQSELDPVTGRESWGDLVMPRFFREEVHAAAPRALSLWRDLESVFAFAYSGAHAEALTRRKEWFVRPEWPSYVAWWVEDHHLPDWHEAAARLEHLHDNGPSAYAFNFKEPYGPDGRPTVIDRSRLLRER